MVIGCQQCSSSTQPRATGSGSEVCPGLEQSQPHSATHLLPGVDGLRGSLPQVDFACGGAGEWGDTKGC